MHWRRRPTYACQTCLSFLQPILMDAWKDFIHALFCLFLFDRAILGSFERILAILTEHTAGKWPLWMSPRQVGYYQGCRVWVRNARHFCCIFLTMTRICVVHVSFMHGPLWLRRLWLYPYPKTTLPMVTKY